jgi:hypothetical protein
MQMATRQRLLKLAAGITIAFGPLTALAAHPAYQAPTVFLADMIFWPIDGAQTGRDPTARLMFAIGGGVFAAWGVCLWFLASDGLARVPDLARRIILTGTWSWFVIDSTGSVLAGAPWNILGNLLLLAMYTLPLANWQARPALD